MNQNEPQKPERNEQLSTAPSKAEHLEIGETIVFGNPNSPAKGFTVPFTIQSSHDINSVGFSGENTISWPTPFREENVTVAGKSILSLEITQPKRNEYLFKVMTDEPLEESSGLALVSTLESHLTLLLNRLNPNPHYGTFFARFDLQDFRLTHVGGGIRMSESLAIRSEGVYRFQEDDWLSVSQSDILAYYCEGAQAGEVKSKYFQWFRIIELLEGSERYREHKDWTPLFSSAEQKLLTAVGEFFGDARKNGIIQELFRRTIQSRHEKLAQFLHELGIKDYTHFNTTTKVQPPILKELIRARNELFHASTKLDEKLLWRHLFPLVTAIADADRLRGLAIK